MSCFFAAVVSLLLYASLNQAAPMVPPNSEEKIASTSENTEIQDSVPQAQQPTSVSEPTIPQIAIRQQLPPLSAPPAPQPALIPPPQIHCTPDVVQLQVPLCPQKVEIPPCPPDQPKQLDQPQQPPQPIQPPKKQTGWKNGIMNILKSINDYFVGEDGCLTNLLTTTGKEYTNQRKQQAKINYSRKGRRFACCVTINNEPSQPASAPQEERPGDGERKTPVNVQIPSISCSWWKNQVSASVQPAGAAGAPAPVPGGKTDHRTSSGSVSCCCTGEKLVNVSGGIINSKIKSQITTCGATMNVSVVDN